MQTEKETPATLQIRPEPSAAKLLKPIGLLLLLVLLVLSAMRVHAMVRGYFQIDYSAYYSAALARLHGQDPYSFTYEDGGTRLEHSEFLQPPIVSDLFVPLALLDYRSSKQAWFIIQIGLLMLSLLLVTGRARVAILVSALLLLASPSLVWPLFAHLERGQTDLLVLFWICLSYFFHKRSLPYPAGACLAVAGVLKLPAFLLLLVPLALTETKVIRAAIIAGVVLFSLSLVLDGLTLNRDYWLEYLPAIASSRALPQDVFNVFTEQKQLSTGHMYWQGESYIVAMNLASGNASFSTFVVDNVKGLPAGIVESIGFLVTALVMLWHRWRIRTNPGAFPEAYRNLSWAFVLTAILVFHPLTWLMNYVWLLAILPLSMGMWKLPGLKLTALLLCGLAIPILIDDPVFSSLRTILVQLTGHPSQSVWGIILRNRVSWAGAVMWCTYVAVLLAHGRRMTLESARGRPLTSRGMGEGSAAPAAAAKAPRAMIPFRFD